MPLLDSNTSHQIMDTNPDEEFSPNSYLLRACPGPQQAAGSGKETVVSECALRSVRHSRVWQNDSPESGAGEKVVWGAPGETRLSLCGIAAPGSVY